MRGPGPDRMILGRAAIRLPVSSSCWRTCRARSVVQLSQGRVRLKIGSLDGMLDRLAGSGPIEPDREESHDGRPRQYYQLAQEGKNIWIVYGSEAEAAVTEGCVRRT